MRHHRRFFTRALVALPAAALALAVTTEARAGNSDDVGAAIGGILITGGTILVTSTVFTIHDVGTVAQREPPAVGWSIAESVLVTPSALLLNTLLAIEHGGEGTASNFLSALLVVPAAWTGAMSVHGIWSLAAPNTDRGTVYGVSWALGANLAFTTGAVSALFDDDRTPPVAFGILEMLGTAPTILVGASQLLGNDDRYRAPWAALTAWSGALFVHGGITLATAIARERREEPMTPEQPQAASAARWFVAPTMVSDGVSRAPGIGVSGVF
ncbi:hypothetical protein [Polyangium sp. 6x1]|uniref:hypothetical protein n=1 Tax=Polyangium sp. 6x1 TaxID=3042689 RepID=UPI002482F7BB|nr:hypothetical protein [Polyangium sp. 6x1]MDI1445594.1 hypothetical protein [Polyangium sp. 6x1]